MTSTSSQYPYPSANRFSTRQRLVLIWPLLFSLGYATTPPAHAGHPLQIGVSCFQSIGLRSTWVVQLLPFTTGGKATQLRGTFLDVADGGAAHSHAFTAQTSVHSTGEYELLVTFDRAQTPSALAAMADKEKPVLWRIARDESLQGTPQLTMTVRDWRLKKRASSTDEDSTYTAKLDPCNARTLDRLKAKPMPRMTQ